MIEGARDLEAYTITRDEYYSKNVGDQERKIIKPNITDMANKIIKAEMLSDIISDKPWIDRAKCNIQKVEANLFFPSTTEGAIVACEYCQDCPVKKECKQYAIDNKEVYGVWGGVDFEREKRRAKYLRNHK